MHSFKSPEMEIVADRTPERKAYSILRGKYWKVNYGALNYGIRNSRMTLDI
jgi:hypothetical protein